MSQYPGGLDLIPTNKVDDTPTHIDHPGHHNLLADALNKLEATLGINPQGASPDVKTRLNGVDASITTLNSQVGTIQGEVHQGAGSPEGTVTAPVGSLYENTTAGAGPVFYVKRKGAGNTGWVSLQPTIGLSPEQYGAVGDGVTDDSAAWTALLAACNALGILSIVCESNKTYKLTAEITFNLAGLRVRWNGSKLLKGANISYLATVSGTNILMEDALLDGNKTAGYAGACLHWTGTGGIITFSTIENGKTFGLLVDGGGQVEAYGLKAISNGDDVAHSGVNFYAGTNGRLRTHFCYSEDAGSTGYFFQDDCAEGCHLEGRSYADYIAAGIYGSLGSCSWFISEYSKNSSVVCTSQGQPPSLTTAFANANSNLVITGNRGGLQTAYTINVVFVNPGANNQLLSAVWSGVENNWTLTITLATDGAGSINIAANKASYVLNAIRSAAPPAALDGAVPTVNAIPPAVVSLAVGNDGSGIVSTMASTPLAGGQKNIPHGWTIGTMRARRAGYNPDGTINTGSASSFVLDGWDFEVGILESKDTQGYALQFGAGGPFRVPARRNEVGTLIADNLEAQDGGDPGLDFSGGSLNNKVGKAVVKGHTLAVTVGETDIDGGDVNEGYYIGQLEAHDCPTGVISYSKAKNGIIGDIRAFNCGTNLSANSGVLPRYGLVSYVATGVTVLGSINIGVNPNLLTVAIASYLWNGDKITIPGAGPAGGALTTYVTAGGGTTALTLLDAASTTVVNATVQKANSEIVGNVIESFEHISTSRYVSRNYAPINLVYADAPTGENVIRRLVASGCKESAVRDDSGNVVTYQRHRKRTRQLFSADPGETGWGGAGVGAGVTTDQTTVGRYSEGSGGKRIAPTGANVIYGQVRTFGAVDLSGMANSEWFRLGLYIENFADANAASAIQIRFGSAGGPFNRIIIPGTEIRRNGLQQLGFRKGDVVPGTTGAAAVDWTAVTSVTILVETGAAGTFAVSIDDLVQLDSSIHDVQAMPKVETLAILLGSGSTPLLDPTISAGSGSPEAVVTASIGSLYVQTDTSTLWKKATGYGSTGWVVVSGRQDELLADVGFVTAPWNPNSTIVGTAAPATGFAFGTLQRIHAGDVLTNGICFMAAVGATLTLSKLIVWSKTGGLLAATADETAYFTNAGNINKWAVRPFATPYTALADDSIYVGSVFVGTTAPTLLTGLIRTGQGAVIKTGKPRLAMQAASQTDAATVTPADTSSTFFHATT